MEYAERVSRYRQQLIDNLCVIEDLLSNNGQYSPAYPFLHRWLTSYGASNGNKLKSMLQYAIDHSDRPMFTSNGNGLFFVSQRYLSKEYKGTLATWNKCIMLMAAFRLINIIKPSEWKLQRGYLNESQYNSLINASKKYGRPINYYYFDSYSLQHLNDVESRIKHFFDAGGNVTGLCKTMLIDLYGQREANMITDDSRKRTQEQRKAERIIEKVAIRYIRQKGFVARDDIIGELMKLSGMRFKAATSHYKRYLPVMKDKYQLKAERIGKRKQEALGVSNSKGFIEILRPK